MIEVSKTKQAAQTGNSMTSAVGEETTLNTRADRIAQSRGNQLIFSNMKKVLLVLVTVMGLGFSVNTGDAKTKGVDATVNSEFGFNDYVTFNNTNDYPVTVYYEITFVEKYTRNYFVKRDKINLSKSSDYPHCMKKVRQDEYRELDRDLTSITMSVY